MFEPTKLHVAIGLGGVAADENKRALSAARVFNALTFLIIFWLAWQWHLEVLGLLKLDQRRLANAAVWMFFIANTLLLANLVDDKQRFLSENWLQPFVILLGIPLVFDIYPFSIVLGHFRLLLVVLLLVPWLDKCRDSLSDNRLGTTLTVALVIMALSGIIIAGIDPAVKNAWDGIWWAWVTVSTVGYGDVVPVSGIGRVFGAILILMGLALFAIFTANFSALFVQRDVARIREESQYIKQLLKNIKEVKSDEDNILNLLRREQSDVKQLLTEMKTIKSEEDDIYRLLQDLSARIKVIESKLDDKD